MYQVKVFYNDCIFHVQKRMTMNTYSVSDPKCPKNTIQNTNPEILTWASKPEVQVASAIAALKSCHILPCLVFYFKGMHTFLQSAK